MRCTDRSNGERLTALESLAHWVLVQDALEHRFWVPVSTVLFRVPCGRRVL